MSIRQKTLNIACIFGCSERAHHLMRAQSRLSFFRTSANFNKNRNRMQLSQSRVGKSCRLRALRIEVLGSRTFQAIKAIHISGSPIVSILVCRGHWLAQQLSIVTHCICQILIKIASMILNRRTMLTQGFNNALLYRFTLFVSFFLHASEVVHV